MTVDIDADFNVFFACIAETCPIAHPCQLAELGQHTVKFLPIQLGLHGIIPLAMGYQIIGGTKIFCQ